jgi:hypothetical protein
VPAAASALNLFDRVDYEDAFRTRSFLDRTPQELMRDVLEGAPAWFLYAWSNILGKAVLGQGLDLRHGPDRVAGWKIVEDNGEMFAIGFDTPRGLDARLFACTSPSEELVGTQIRLNSPYARRWWPAIRLGHRFFLPYLLRRSARRAARRAAVQQRPPSA